VIAAACAYCGHRLQHWNGFSGLMR
jgi:hypothetical protein